MAFYTPQFQGRWARIGKKTINIERVIPRVYKSSGKRRVRVLGKERTVEIYEKTTDADNGDVMGDKLAVEDTNLPVSGLPYESRLGALTCKYDLETGAAFVTKVRFTEDESWTKIRDLPARKDKKRIY